MSASTVSASRTLGGEHDTRPSMMEFIVTSSAGTPLLRMERRTLFFLFAIEKQSTKKRGGNVSQRVWGYKGGGGVCTYSSGN